MIDIKDLKYKYAGSRRYVFSDCNRSMDSNNIYGLLGKNGMGKSTLLYLISGLLRRNGGTISINGLDTINNRAEMLSEIFLVPEEFDLLPMSLEAYVKMNKPFYPNFSREVLESCLRDFELTPDINLKELSMGQKKKGYMSFALAANTKLLWRDGPTNGLDIPSKSQFRRVIANNMDEGRTMIISTHQVHDVESLLDHILILDHSELLLNASVSDICSKYSFGYRQVGEPTDDVLYAEPSVQGSAVITRKQTEEEETQLNLELLFDAVTQKALTF